ncbi:MAG: SH3 domain-containing protein [Aggregatilineales bacterium]
MTMMRSALRLNSRILIVIVLGCAALAAGLIQLAPASGLAPSFAVGPVTVTRTPLSSVYTQGSIITIAIGIQNDGTDAAVGELTINPNLAGAGLTFNTFIGSTYFDCTLGFPCTNNAFFPANDLDVVTFTAIAATAGSNYTLTGTVDDAADLTSTPFSPDLNPFSIVPPIIDLTVFITHDGVPPGSPNFEVGSTTGVVSVTVQNIGQLPSSGPITLTISLQGQLVPNGPFISGPQNLFTCSGPPILITCTTPITAVLNPNEFETVSFNVSAPSQPLAGPFFNFASVSGGGDQDPSNNTGNDPVPFSIAPPPTGTPTITPPPTPTLTPLPSITPIPTITPTFTATFIPPPPTRTPLPRPANAGLAIPIPPSGINIVVNRDGVNIRLIPAIGAEVLGFVNAGTVFENVEARSPDNQWLRINFLGQQAWIGTPVITVLAGDIEALPVADPRTIPYGGFENPRAGLTNATSPFTGRLADSGLRLRAGPSRAYPVLANAPRYTVFPLLGRTADNTWLQVNFEGTLGWVAAQFVELSSIEALSALPVDGIVADALPISDPGVDSLNDTLRLLRDRLDLAQPSLDAIRAIWTNIALGGRAECGTIPARPSNYNIANTVLAPHFDTLNPLITDFNAAMTFIRQAIDLLLGACGFAQPPEGLVGEGAVSLALEAVNAADALFLSLRIRLEELIPPDRVPGPDECVFTFRNESEIVPRLLPGQVRTGVLSPRVRVLGFCFDAEIGASYRIEGVRVSGNILPLISVSAFANPTNFIGVGRIGQGEFYVSISPILIPETGQYIVIVSDLSDTPRPQQLGGEFALLLTDVTGISGQLAPGITVDAGGNIIVNPQPGQIIAPQPGQPIVTAVPPVSGPQTGVVCPSLSFTCAQLLSCAEAFACLAAGNLSLDPEGNGIPCQQNLCIGSPAQFVTPIPTAPIPGSRN